MMCKSEYGCLRWSQIVLLMHGKSPISLIYILMKKIYAVMAKDLEWSYLFLLDKYGFALKCNTFSGILSLLGDI